MFSTVKVSDTNYKRIQDFFVLKQIYSLQKKKQTIKCISDRNPGDINSQKWTEKQSEKQEI